MLSGNMVRGPKVNDGSGIGNKSPEDEELRQPELLEKHNVQEIRSPDEMQLVI